MERLQIAIEKARANREKAQASPPSAAATPLPGHAARPGAPASAETGTGDPWMALAELTLKPRILQRNRVVTLEASADSLPFDLLRTRIMQQATKEGWRRIAILSPHSASGKSTLTTNLAFSFGRQPDVKTLVLDFDMRRPSLARMLDCQPRHSMSDVIDGRVAFADHAIRHQANLAFGLNRVGVKNASELLQGRDTVRLLAELDEVWKPDFMLFDMPPLLATDDALGFLTQVDAALIVAEAERTPISQIDAAEAQVAELTHVLGVVLNRCNYADKDAGTEKYY